MFLVQMCGETDQFSGKNRLIQWLSITCDIGSKKSRQKVEFWWMSIISASLPKATSVHIRIYQKKVWTLSTQSVHSEIRTIILFRARIASMLKACSLGFNIEVTSLWHEIFWLSCFSGGSYQLFQPTWLFLWKKPWTHRQTKNCQCFAVVGSVHVLYY